MIDEDALSLMLGEARAMLSEAGLSVRTVVSVQDQEAEMLGLRDRKNHPVLSHLQHDFAADDAFGILLDDGEGLAGGMACKHIRLGRDNLTNHLISSNRRLYGEGLVATNPLATGRMTGNLVYQGELNLRERHRKADVSTAVMHVAHSLCALKWRADWHYAFMPIAILNKAPAFGFHHFHLCTQTYHSSITTRTSLECLVYSERCDLCERARVVSERPSLMRELSLKTIA